MPMKKNDAEWAWAGLDNPIQPQVQGMFQIPVVTQGGSGTNTMFWTDRWLQTCSHSRSCSRDGLCVQA